MIKHLLFLIKRHFCKHELLENRSYKSVGFDMGSNEFLTTRCRKCGYIKTEFIRYITADELEKLAR